MKAVILLGGMGTRLRPLTCKTPKPMLPILNKPSLLYQIELLKKHGIKEITFCLGYLSKEFNNYFSDGKKFGVKINYIFEKIPLGTGGAIRNAQKYINNTTIIFNGDTLTDINLSNLISFHHQKKSILTIALVKVKDPTIYGLVETDNSCRIKRFLEKPSWDEVTTNNINAGIYLFEPRLLDFIPSGINYSVERGLFPYLLEKKYPVYGYIATKSYWMDIGTVEKYLQAHFDILKGEAKLIIPGKKLNKNIWTSGKTKIDSTATIEGKAVIGVSTKVESFVQLSGIVSIGKNCRIKRGSVINDSVILDNTIIGEGSKIDKTVIGKNCNIEPHVSLIQGAVGDSTIITRYSKL